MEELIVVGLALLGGAVVLVGGLLGYEFVWKPRQRRAIERAHARNKLR